MFLALAGGGRGGAVHVEKVPFYAELTPSSFVSKGKTKVGTLGFLAEI